MVHLQGASGHVSLMAPDTPRGSLRLGNGRELNQGYGRWAALWGGQWAVGGGLWAVGGTPAGAMGTGRYVWACPWSCPNLGLLGLHCRRRQIQRELASFHRRQPYHTGGAIASDESVLVSARRAARSLLWVFSVVNDPCAEELVVAENNPQVGDLRR